MSDQALAAAEPTRQSIEVKTRTAVGKVTGKLREAVTLMVENGTRWDEAALQVGLTVRTMRLALERPYVVAHLKAVREVFRVRASAANIHRLTQIRDAADNMPAVNAIKALEQLGDEVYAGAAAQRSAPGLVIVIQTASGQSVESPKVIEGKADE